MPQNTLLSLWRRAKLQSLSSSQRMSWRYRTSACTAPLTALNRKLLLMCLLAQSRWQLNNCHQSTYTKRMSIRPAHAHVCGSCRTRRRKKQRPARKPSLHLRQPSKCLKHSPLPPPAAPPTSPTPAKPSRLPQHSVPSASRSSTSAAVAAACQAHRQTA